MQLLWVSFIMKFGQGRGLGGLSLGSRIFLRYCYWRRFLEQRRVGRLGGTFFEVRVFSSWRGFQIQGGGAGSGQFLRGFFSVLRGASFSVSLRVLVGMFVGGVYEVKLYFFFRAFDWAGLLRYKVEFVSQLEVEDDISYFDSERVLAGGFCGGRGLFGSFRFIGCLFMVFGGIFWVFGFVRLYFSVV